MLQKKAHCHSRAPEACTIPRQNLVPTMQLMVLRCFTGVETHFSSPMRARESHPRRALCIVAVLLSRCNRALN